MDAPENPAPGIEPRVGTSEFIAQAQCDASRIERAVRGAEIRRREHAVERKIVGVIGQVVDGHEHAGAAVDQLGVKCAGDHEVDAELVRAEAEVSRNQRRAGGRVQREGSVWRHDGIRTAGSRKRRTIREERVVVVVVARRDVERQGRRESHERAGDKAPRQVDRATEGGLVPGQRGRSPLGREIERVGRGRVRAICVLLCRRPDIAPEQVQTGTDRRVGSGAHFVRTGAPRRCEHENRGVHGGRSKQVQSALVRIRNRPEHARRNLLIETDGRHLR